MIIKHPKTEEVLHLTTAAGILMMAAIGAAIIVIIVNRALIPLEEWIVR